MKTKICLSCNQEFPRSIKIDGKRINLDGRSYCLECSPYGSNNSKKLKYLKEHENDKLDDTQKQILNGHLLGDGGLVISKRSINAHFKIQRKLDDKNYLLWSASFFQNMMAPLSIGEGNTFDKRTNKTYCFIYLKTKSSSLLTEYHHKWYPEGKKIIPKDLILTPLTIAVWLADDGCIRHVYRKSLRIEFATYSFSKNDVDFLHSQLVDRYGNKIIIQKINKEGQFIIRSTDTQTVKGILRDIDPVFPPLYRKSDIWKELL
jgi:hypothetical protein